MLPRRYNKELLAILPDEIIEKDYGCGDPSRYVRAGDTVGQLAKPCWWAMPPYEYTPAYF